MDDAQSELLVRRPVPPRIFLLGPSGSGKTIVARAVAETRGWPLYDTDEEILRSTGALSIAEIFKTQGEDVFRRLEVEHLEQIAAREGKLVVATGGGLPITPGSMERILALGITVYLRARVETLWARLTMFPERLNERPLIRDGGEEGLREQIALRQNTYLRSSVIFDTDYRGLGDVVDYVSSMMSGLEKMDG